MSRFVDRITHPWKTIVVHHRPSLTSIVLKSGTHTCAHVMLGVLALGFLSPNMGANQVQAVTWSVTAAQRQTYVSYTAPVVLERAEEPNDKAGPSLMTQWGCVPCHEH